MYFHKVHVGFYSLYFFQVINDPIKGQCVVATRLIKPLEIIFAEFPAVVGPYAWPGKHQCLECFRVITDVQVRFFKAQN